MSEIIIGGEAAVAAMARKPIEKMSMHEMATELALVREQNDRLGQVLSVAAPNVAAIQDERDRAVVERDGLRAEIERLHERLKKRGKSAVRDAGEHWYELTQIFDPNEIKLLPLPDGKRAFLMGVIDDLVIVEVPKDTPAAAARGFQEFLQKQGLQSAAIVVTAGVQFLRLRRTTAKQERKLDATLSALVPTTTEEQEPDAPPSAG